MADGEVKADQLTTVAEDSNLAEPAAPPREITARFPTGFVAWILSRKWVGFDEDPDDNYDQMINNPYRPEWYTQEYLEEERETMREMIAHNERCRVGFEKFQDWVRRQLDEKGYVEVGESYLEQCAINRQSIPAEEWSALMGGHMDELKLDGR